MENQKKQEEERKRKENAKLGENDWSLKRCIHMFNRVKKSAGTKGNSKRGG